VKKNRTKTVLHKNWKFSSKSFLRVLEKKNIVGTKLKTSFASRHQKILFIEGESIFAGWKSANIQPIRDGSPFFL